MKKLIITIWILVLTVVININRSEGQWEQVGPYGGYVDVADGFNNRIFAYQSWGGMYRSLDNGNNWSPAQTENMYITSIEVTSSSVFAAGEGKIYRSINDGESWDLIFYMNQFGGDSFIKLCNGILFASGDGAGIFRSLDNGNNWTHAYDAEYRTFSDFASLGSDIFATSDGVWRADSTGSNWIQISQSFSGFRKIIVFGSDLFAICNNGVVRSTNNGISWSEMNTGLPNLHINSISYIGSNLFVTAENSVFISSNNGNSWTPINNGLPSLAKGVLFTNESTLFVGCGGTGIYQTTNNGILWSESNKGLAFRNLTELTSNSQYLFSVVNNGTCQIYRSSDLGISWNVVINPVSSYIYEMKLTVKDNFIFCGIVSANENISGNIYRSSNNGDNWELKNSGHNRITCLASSSSDIYAGFKSQGIFRSSDYGNNWISINDGLNLSHEYNSLISAGNYLFLSSTFGHGYRSNNNGGSWFSIYSGGGDLFTNYTYNGIFLFAASEYGIKRSSTYGSGWEDMNNGISSANPNSLTSLGNNIFVGNDSGIYYSNNNGLSWSKKNEGLNANKNVNQLYINDNQLFAGIENGSGWKRAISEITYDLPFDAGVAQIIEPVQDTIRYTDCESYYIYIDFKTLVRNYSINNQQAFFDVKLEVNYNGSVVYSEVKQDVLGSGQEHSLNFTSHGFDPLAIGVYTVKCWTILQLDTNIANDTATSTFSIVNPNFGNDNLGLPFGYYFANSTPGASCAPDQPVFYWEDTTGSVNLISGGIAKVPLSGGNLDDGYFILRNILPGNLKFQFYGVCYDSFVISTNGIIGMGGNTSGLSNPNPQNIPNSVTGAAIYPLWCNFNFGGSSIAGRNLKYKVAPHGINGVKVIITFDRVPVYQASDINDYVSFQVILEPYEVCGPGFNGMITIQYDNSKCGSTFLNKYNNNSLQAHSVGIQSGTEIGSIQYRYRKSDGAIVTPGSLFGSPLAVSFGSNNLVLPVELSSFTSSVNENKVTLNWQTYRESNNSGFKIERSVAKDKWINAGFVNANGNSNEPKDYFFTDKNLAPGKYNYRLKQIDFNGNYEYFNLSDEVIIGIPDKYELSQNYPNPFNPVTNLEFGISESGVVSLKVYDVLGKEVKTLVNEIKQAGYYKVQFDGSSFASGVYFYELRAGNFVSQKRMLLLK